MKKIIFLLPIIIVSFGIPKPEKSNISFYEVDLQKERVELVWKDSSDSIYGSIGNVLQSDSNLNLVMNAGMYTAEQKPLGLYIENGNVLKSMNKTQTAYGNFYMQPNGVFYITKYSAFITQSSEFIQSENIQFATQSGPMLIINGKYHLKFKNGSNNLNIRNGVGILPNGNPIFAISNTPINFYDFAKFFKEKGCKNALYLDGAISRAYIPSKGLYDKKGKFGVMIIVKSISN